MVASEHPRPIDSLVAKPDLPQITSWVQGSRWSRWFGRPRKLRYPIRINMMRDSNQATKPGSGLGVKNFHTGWGLVSCISPVYQNALGEQQNK